MRGLWLLWLGLPNEAQVLVAGAIVTTLVDMIRLLFPKIDGRWVHLLTLLVGGASAVLTALASSLAGTLDNASGAIVTTLAIFAQATVAAIGLNEIKRGPGRLGKSRETANARQFLFEHRKAAEARLQHRRAPAKEGAEAKAVEADKEAAAGEADGGKG